MRVNSISIKILIILIVLPLLFSFAITESKASITIPEKYSQELDLNKSYLYNVTQFDSKFTWLDLNWGPRGDAFTNPGGQIIVNFTGFYDKDPNAFGKSCFNDPIPHINITFLENNTGILTTNTSFYNVSNSEAGLSLAIGYNSFHSGFLIQITDIENLIVLAEEQVNKSGFMPGEFTYEEYDFMVEFIFEQDNRNQNSTMIYDKSTGILVYSKVESVFGPDLEIYLSDYELNFQKTGNGIPGFLGLIFGITIISILIIMIPTIRRKIRLN